MVNVSTLLSLPDLTGDLHRVEEVLHRSVAAEDPYLTEVAGHLIRAGGKRLRPALTLAAAGGTTEASVHGAVAVELVHLGSLYHDDVMDEASIRRGVPTVNERWGNLVAILAGDFLLARASEIAAGLGTEIAALLANTIGRLCEGQLAELKTVYDVNRTESAYMLAISGKTAALMASACRIGGLVAGRSRTDVEALTSFGHAFGVVFQIVDDVLDVISTEEELGKPVGQDLVEGVYTLPVLRTLQRPEGDKLRAMLGRRLSAEERDEARTIVRDAGGIEAALAVARDHADRAAEAAGSANGGPAFGGAGHRLIDTLEGR